MAPYGPPDEFNRQPTQQANFGPGGYLPANPPPPPPVAEAPLETAGPPDEPFEPEDLDAEPTPWYRNPVAFIGWLALVVILIGLIVFGISELIGGDQGTSRTPPGTSTTIPPATTTTQPPTTTTTATPPPTSSAVEPPPPQPTWQSTLHPTQQPTHDPHLPPLPSVITIPGLPSPITLPPGLTE
ncbi:hypothetical protein [Mycobacterium lacus]|uniref:Uncharacterized protein n=1 Tax=Mycobacterium lacus TaxID=169765 RepID=A0A1X1Y5S7_9MYCO|nr:hypothetical protein [Mycobacterium lacus]MCV7121960.1 hypothetical protein [Mycobacterium lacus]ORW06370.1 hypothetical protein AWC15_21830 [Mycobacterium lacus]BBX98542.1 hypothetical protein MLAC_38360 [Mycobacterium lacus]